MTGPAPPRVPGSWFLLGSLAVTGLLLIAGLRDARRPWKPYQRAFIRSERRAAGTPAEREAAANLRVGIRQIEAPGLGRIDRCTTCHLAVEHPGYADAAPPLRTHPHPGRHPFQEFGCTVCHRGNGLATTAEAAHEGMLPREFTTASCMACHVPDYLPGAARLNEGRRLFEAHGCRACHRLEGEGGRVGPELDGVGDRRGIDWMIRHFRDPAAVSPGSAMPPVQLDEEGLRTLTLYVTGLTRPVGDPDYLTRRILPTVEAGRDLYFGRGCIGCHALGGVGGDLGPDLTRPDMRRTEAWLTFFLKRPHRLAPGTLMPDPMLRPDERDAVVAFLLRLDDPEFVEEAVSAVGE